ncbi:MULTISPECIES: single-stranded DNA-binding protein [Sphingomonadaceae]|uniref:Single-stranded DNA-binding protein n=1 Tax=Sphingobium baderi TaxID=1332080 RepID=A0A0S3F6B2_9SPHN|nr:MULTISPECIES: single-stranded DNA-binding protein [Sphingomonadaceae]ALR23202.1 single-stranded DNA-binding protein [Sphingobium baderi]CDO37909.1 conserved hypothetical protein [Novosphingobium sp. KN65.2]
MRNLAKFEIIGRVGSIQANGNVTHLKLAANYRRKEGDNWTDDTYWNRVTVFGEGTRKYISDKLNVGDLVRAAGRMRDTSYEKDGQTIYATDRVVDEFGILASKAGNDE